MNWVVEGFALNNREIATAVWAGVVISTCSLKRELRSAMWGVLQALCQPILLTALTVATLWIGASVLLMEREGLWEVANLKTTVVWAITFAFVTMFDVDKIGKPGFAGSVVRDTINATVVVVFIAEFATFSFWGELVLVPFLFVLSLLRVVAATKPEFVQVRKLLEGLAVLVGLGILIFSIYTIAREFTAFARRNTALEFSVPIILSLLFLPFIFVFGRWVAYERVFSAFFYAVPDPTLRRYARWRGFLAFGADIEGLDRWRNMLVRLRPETRAGVDDAVIAVKVAQGREKNPPVVEADIGWSPYAAKAFLEGHGLGTNAWQDSGDGEWSCSATLMALDDGLPPNRLGYYLLGDAIVARRLRLKLYVNNPTLAAAAEAQFVQVAADLLQKVGLGQFSGMLDNPSPIDSRADDGTNSHVVTLTRENWGGGIEGGYERMLTVRSRTYEKPDN